MPAQKRWHEQDLVLKDFSGGENYTDSEIRLLPNELSELRNMVPDKRGALQKRLGISKYNAVELQTGDSNARIFALQRFYRENATDVVLAVANKTAGSERVWNVATTGASTDLGLDHNAAANYGFVANKARMAQYRDRVYGIGFNTTTHSECRNFVVAEHPGTSTALLAWEMGVTVPTKTGTLAETDDGGLLDLLAEYKYKIAYFYGEDGAHGESNPAAEVAHTLTGTNETITITLWADNASHQFKEWDEAHDAGIDKVRIYRTVGGGSEFFFLADVTSGNSYKDKIADSALDDTTLPQTDNYVPDKGRYLCVHNDRMVMGHLYDGTDYFPKRVRWSLAGSPDIWPANNYADAPAEHGDLTGVTVIAGQLYVFYESAIARLSLHGGSDNQFEIVTATVGCWAPRSLAIGEELDREVAFFMAADGRIYGFNGVSAYCISRVLDTRLGEYTPWSTYVCGGWDGESYRLGYRATKNGSQMAKGWELRYNTTIRRQDPYTQENLGTWWPMWLAVEQVPNVYCRFAGGSDEGALYWGSYSSGFIYKSDSGNDDDGTDFGYYFYTAYLDCGDGGLEKYFDSMMIDSESDTALTVTVDKEWGTEIGSFTTTTGTNPVRSYYDPSGRNDFRHIRIKVEGSDGDDPSTVYALILRVGAARPARKIT